jgi:hypothetical protein
MDHNPALAATAGNHLVRLWACCGDGLRTGSVGLQLGLRMTAIHPVKELEGRAGGG